MKNLVFLLVLLIACDARLSDEQRKKMREQMELHKIKKVSDAQITEAAYAKGRAIVSEIEKLQPDSAAMTAAISARGNTVRFLRPGASNASSLEAQLIEAYLADPAGGGVDNIQKMRNSQGVETDSILYTRPVLTKLPDGSEVLEGVWNVWLSKKQLIIEMK